MLIIYIHDFEIILSAYSDNWAEILKISFWMPNMTNINVSCLYSFVLLFTVPCFKTMNNSCFALQLLLWKYMYVSFLITTWSSKVSWWWSISNLSSMFYLEFRESSCGVCDPLLLHLEKLLREIRPAGLVFILPN